MDTPIYIRSSKITNLSGRHIPVYAFYGSPLPLQGLLNNHDHVPWYLYWISKLKMVSNNRFFFFLSEKCNGEASDEVDVMTKTILRQSNRNGGRFEAFFKSVGQCSLNTFFKRNPRLHSPLFLSKHADNVWLSRGSLFNDPVTLSCTRILNSITGGTDNILVEHVRLSCKMDDW